VEYKTGVEAFLSGLIGLGYSPAQLPGKPDHLVFDYLVETGSNAGKTVRLGLVIPQDFPFTPPSGPHVSPPIHPSKPGGEHPYGGIHETHSQAFRDGAGGAWQYWSRPFVQTKKTFAAYMSHIWQLWDSQ
jgi:hypothetical protein